MRVWTKRERRDVAVVCWEPLEEPSVDDEVARRVTAREPGRDAEAVVVGRRALERAGARRAVGLDARARDDLVRGHRPELVGAKHPGGLDALGGHHVLATRDPERVSQGSGRYEHHANQDGCRDMAKVYIMHLMRSARMHGRAGNRLRSSIDNLTV